MFESLPGLLQLVMMCLFFTTLSAVGSVFSTVLQTMYKHNSFHVSNVSHCWLPAKVMYPANSIRCFSWLTRSTSILLRMKNVEI